MDTKSDFYKDAFSRLVSLCSDLKISTDQNTQISSATLSSFVTIFNEIFDAQCVDFIYTYNTDNLFFGVRVSPTITNVDLMTILLQSDPMSITRYMVELDSRVFNVMDAEEVAVYLINDISHMLSEKAITNLRTFLDVQFAICDDNIDLKNSINYSQILIYGVKDALKKMTSLIYQLDSDNIYFNENLYSYVNEYISDINLVETLAIVGRKVRNCIFDMDRDVIDSKLTTLQWVLLLYKNLSTEYKDAINTLTDARSLTGSRLDKDEIDRTIKSLNRAASELITESTIVYETVLKEFGLFKAMKQHGLKGIEDDLYEFKIRLKACTEEDDAIYILRQINSRLALLEDYVYRNQLPEHEKKHWESVIQDYRDLRVELGKKKLGKKNYGIFVDYNALDQLDKPEPYSWYS